MGCGLGHACLHWQSLQPAQNPGRHGAGPPRWALEGPPLPSLAHAQHSSVGLGQVAAPLRMEKAPIALLSSATLGRVFSR